MLEPDLKTFLDAAVPDAEGRVHPGWLPEGAPLPAVSYFCVSSPRELAHGGPPNYCEATYQIDLWAPSYREAKTMGTALRERLHGLRGDFGVQGTRLGRGHLVDERDLYEDDTRIWRVSQDYALAYKE